SSCPRHPPHLHSFPTRRSSDLLSDRTSKAVIKHCIKLNGATLAADTSAVLSEGEHRAVALAAFMAELKMYPGKDAIVIDDPVSRSEEHTSELQSRGHLVCRLLL